MRCGEVTKSPRHHSSQVTSSAVLFFLWQRIRRTHFKMEYQFVIMNFIHEERDFIYFEIPSEGADSFRMRLNYIEEFID